MNVLAAITHVEDLLLESRSFTLFTNQFHVGKELHLDSDSAVALANLATAARKIKREVRRIESAGLRFACSGKDFPDRIVDLDIGNRIGSWRPTDGRLIDKDYVVNQLSAFQLVKRADMSLPVSLLLFQPGIDAIVNQGRLARATDAGHANHHVERQLHINRFQVVLGRPR